MIKLKLSKNLRRRILQGHPWVYRQALSDPPFADKSQMCQVNDSKGEFLAWAIYHPEGPLALRILSTEKKPPNFKSICQRLSLALRLREHICDTHTNAFRLFNGEGDRLPGLVVDIYNDTAVLQYDGPGAKDFWETQDVPAWVLENTSCQTVIEKPRFSDMNSAEKKLDHSSCRFWGKPLETSKVQVYENNKIFFVDVIQGQKTGFFLDQRENRQYISRICKDLNVINLFSYSGGFSIYAGSGGAKHVTSVDISPKAINLAKQNWDANSLDIEKHSAECADVFEYLKLSKDLAECLIVDPPSMASSEIQKPIALNKYTALFATAAKKVSKEGHLVLSSCSSHISFPDFFEIIESSLSKAQRRGRILKVSGQGPDHPFPHICPELRYLKFAHLLLD